MKPIQQRVKDPAYLPRLGRPLMTPAYLSQGHSLDARADLGTLHGSDAVRVCTRVTG